MAYLDKIKVESTDYELYARGAVDTTTGSTTTVTGAQIADVAGLTSKDYVRTNNATQGLSAAQILNAQTNAGLFTTGSVVSSFTDALSFVAVSTGFTPTPDPTP